MAILLRGRRWVPLVIGVTLVSVVAAAGAVRALVPGSPSSRLLVAQVSKSTDWSSGEGWVVVNPTNPQSLVADWTSFPWGSPAAVVTPPGPRPIQCGEAYSTDGGSAWVEATLPPFEPDGLPVNAGACVDPTLVVDSTGMLYALSDGGSLIPGAATTSPGVASFCCSFSRSSDGGRTWSAPTQVATFVNEVQSGLRGGSPDPAFDRPWLLVDPQTSTLYASLSDDTLVQRVVFASHDHGATWAGPYPLDPDLQTVWGDVPSAANGVLAAGYRVDPNSTGYKLSLSPAVTCSQVCAVFETSTNDGKTWQRHVIPTPQLASASSGPGPGGSGVQVAADPSTTGRYAALVPVSPSSDQVWITTDSGATTWVRALTVDAPGGATVVKPWIAYGPNGALGVVWRSLHSDKSYDVSAAVSTDGGLTFGSPVELTPAPAPAPASPQGEPGDDCACNLSLNGAYLYTTWGDARTGNLQIWFARYRY